MLESNMPIGIFMGYQDQLVAVYVVNDHAYDVGECEAVLVVTDLNGNELYKAVLNFVILAFVVFCMVKAVNRVAHTQKKEETPPAPPAPSHEEKLLTEIRDLLKERR